MDVGKRTCFRMTRGGGRPFVMRAPGKRVRMAKAGFCMRTCSSGSSFIASLVRNSIGIAGSSESVALHPSRVTCLRGKDLQVRRVRSCGVCE